MIVHLLVNSTILTGATVFQKNVYQIHSLEDALVFIEWTFIFLPILFHAILGVVIVYGGLPNFVLPHQC
jgi:succinate dehydrogenase / fumarate reductase, cytochrome b subunit